MLDKRLHQERLASGGKPPPISSADLAALPDGAMFGDGSNAYALREQARHCAGRFPAMASLLRQSALAGRTLRLLTPATTLAVLRHGYQPVWSAR